MKINAHKITTGVARYFFLVVAAALWARLLIDATLLVGWIARSQEVVPLEVAALVPLFGGALCLLFAFSASRNAKPAVALGLSVAGLVATAAYWIVMNVTANSIDVGEYQVLVPGFRFWDSVIYFLGTNPLVLQWLFFLITVDLGAFIAPIAVGMAIAAFASRPQDLPSVGPLVKSRYPVLSALAVVGLGLQSLALVVVTANIDAVLSPTLSFGFSFDSFDELFSNPDWLVSFAIVMVALGVSAIGQAGVNVWIAGLVASYARDKGYSWALFFWITWLLAPPALMLIIAIALKRKTPAVLAEV